MHFSGLVSRSENEVEHNGREYDQSKVPIRSKAPQAILRIVDIERGHLPEEMGTRGRHAKEEHDLGAGQALSDEQFALLEPMIRPARPGGRPRTTDMRRLLDGLFYLVRTGCQWRHLPPPPAFPPWRTVYGYMRAFEGAGVWEAIRHRLVVMLREREGREPSPTAAIVDTQSVRTTEKGGLAATTPPRR